MIQSTLAPASRKNQKPVERSLRFTPARAATDAVLGLFVGKLATFYILTVIRSDFLGTVGVQLDKLSATEPDVYHLLIEEDGHVRCDCIGHEAHGRCKHADAVKELAARGELTTPHTEAHPPATVRAA